MSSTGGSAWNEIDNTMDDGYCIALGSLYQGGSWDDDGNSMTPSVMAVFKSLGNQGGWERKAIMPSLAGQVLCMAVCPNDRSTLFAGGWNASGAGRYMRMAAFFKSTDAGSTWNTLFPASSGTVRAMWIDPHRPESIFLGTDTGVWTSNGGASWTPPSTVFSVSSLVDDMHTTGRLFAGTSSGVYATSDRGVRWSALGNGLSIIGVQCMDMDTLNRILYAGTVGGGIYRLILETGMKVQPASPDRISAFALHPNHPNPFNSTTCITFVIKKTGQVRLTVHDTNGRAVKTLVDARENPGEKKVSWDGTDERGKPVPSGVYIFRLSADEGFSYRKAVLSR